MACASNPRHHDFVGVLVRFREGMNPHQVVGMLVRFLRILCCGEVFYLWLGRLLSITRALASVS